MCWHVPLLHRKFKICLCGRQGLSWAASVKSGEAHSTFAPEIAKQGMAQQVTLAPCEGT